MREQRESICIDETAISRGAKAATPTQVSGRSRLPRFGNTVYIKIYTSNLELPTLGIAVLVRERECCMAASEPREHYLPYILPFEVSFVIGLLMQGMISWVFDHEDLGPQGEKKYSSHVPEVGS